MLLLYVCLCVCVLCPCAPNVWWLSGIRAKMCVGVWVCVASWNVLTALGHALDIVFMDEKQTHTPWSLVCMGIHAWGLYTTKQCWIVSKPPNKQACAKLAQQIATKFSVVWLVCRLAVELINIESSRSFTNDGGGCSLQLKISEWQSN